jgi:beta-glucanase (GH16 family)
MKGIASTGAPKIHVPGWMGGWVDGWMGGWVGVKAVLRIAYSNQKLWNFHVGKN